MDVMLAAERDRADLLDLLTDLEPSGWAAPSLRQGWTVRDVVAHVLSYEGVRPAELAGRLVAMAGRRSVVADLSGPGSSTLQRRPG